MLLRLCGPPSIPLSFNLAIVLPRWITYRFRLATEGRPPTTSDHRLRRGLPGYLILFDTHAFVHERQCQVRGLSSRSAFCGISKHFTATHHIPATPLGLQSGSIKGTAAVELQYFTPDLPVRLRTL